MEEPNYLMKTLAQSFYSLLVLFSNKPSPDQTENVYIEKNIRTQVEIENVSLFAFWIFVFDVI